VNGIQKTLLQDKTSGFKGNFHSSGVIRVNVDAYLYVIDLAAIGGYGRIQATGADPRTSAGVGVLLGQKGAPGKIAIAILYQFNDLFNQLNKENEFLKRGGVNVVVGYNI
jgi:hypothetical protein